MRSPRVPVPVLLLVTAGIACGSKAGSSAALDGYAVERSPLARDTSPALTPGDLTTLVNDNTDFAFALYPGVATDETSNVFYSPYSVSLALAMTYEGAGGETASQIATAMSWELPLARLGPTFDALDLAVETNANASGGTLSVADAIWGDSSLTFNAPFLDVLATDFGAGANVTSFAADPSQAMAAINGWVAGETAQKITNLLVPPMITKATQAVLVNAVYFDGSWDTPFPASATANAPFTRLDGTVVQASEMANVLAASYATFTGGAAVELTYDSASTSMLVVLPDAGQFATVEKELATSFLQGITSSLSPCTVTLDLPKFTVQGATFSVAEQLQSLGMVDAFEKGVADFSPMSTPAVAELSDVVQQAYVSVDETGTVAAAATAVIGDDAGVVEIPPPPVVMNVNRPFFFFILENSTQTVLFAGRELDPTK